MDQFQCSRTHARQCGTRRSKNRVLALRQLAGAVRWETNVQRKQGNCFNRETREYGVGAEGFPEEVTFCFLDENIPYAKAWGYSGREYW